MKTISSNRRQTCMSLLSSSNTTWRLVCNICPVCYQSHCTEAAKHCELNLKTLCRCHRLLQLSPSPLSRHPLQRWNAALLCILLFPWWSRVSADNSRDQHCAKFGLFTALRDTWKRRRGGKKRQHLCMAAVCRAGNHQWPPEKLHTLFQLQLVSWSTLQATVAAELQTSSQLLKLWSTFFSLSAD